MTPAGDPAAFPVVEIGPAEGDDPGALGHAYGRAARDRVALTLAHYRDVLPHYTGWEWERIAERSLAYLEPAEAHLPGVRAELEGIASGAGVRLADVAAINARTELIFGAIARGARVAPPAECTAIGLEPGATALGEPLVAQNWDWFARARETLVVLVVRRRRLPSYATVVEAGLLAKVGVNSAGLAVATNALGTDRDDGRPAVPYHVILRSLFDCAGAEPAAERIRSAERASSANYLLADAGGALIDLETVAGGAVEVYERLPEDGRIVHANHLEPEAREHHRDLEAEAHPDSFHRRRRLTELAAGGRPGPTELERMLADHDGHPLSVCAHPRSDAHPLERFETAAGVVIEPAARRMRISSGPPCLAGFRELSL